MNFFLSLRRDILTLKMRCSNTKGARFNHLRRRGFQPFPPSKIELLYFAMDPAVIRPSKCKAACCAKSAAAPPPKSILKTPVASPIETAPPPPPPEPPKKVEFAPPQQPPKESVHPPAANNEVAPHVDPRSGNCHGRAFHPTAQQFPPPVHMRGCWEDIDPPLSRIPRLENIDATLARGYRPNEFYYDAHYYGCPPLPAPPPRDYYSYRHHHRRHYYHYGPPPMEYDFQHHRRGELPPMEYDFHHHRRGGPPPTEYDFYHHHRNGPPLPPPHVYYPYGYFSDENPNGCNIM